MTAEILLIIIIWLVIFEFVLDEFLDYVNVKKMSPQIPEEVKGIYDSDKYSMSQKYEKEKYKFWVISSIFSLVLMIVLLLSSFFWSLDLIVRTYIQNEILVSLTYFWILVIGQTIISLPFSYYSTFVIEQRYGFNNSTKKIFFLDTIKSVVLSLIMWWIIGGLIIFTYLKLQDSFWIYAWAILTFFSIFMIMFYSNIIVPLFNKQTPLEDGELKSAIESFANKVWFKLDNIYVIDGSKRSKKANAYFTWLWAKKRIVLYDTLISDMTKEEIVAVLAHEIGHYKRKHTLQMLLFSIVQTGFMLYILGITLWYDIVAEALWADKSSFHVWMIAFTILFTPISMVLWIFWNILSRKNEYEADMYAKVNYSSAELISALKKLSVNNLTNLTPHPAYEFFYYSHPTVLKRIKKLGE